MDDIYRWAVYDTQEHELTEFATHDEALKEYERVKGEILVPGEPVDESYEVYIFKLDKKAFLVKDEENTENPEQYGFDYFVKWQDEDIK